MIPYDTDTLAMESDPHPNMHNLEDHLLFMKHIAQGDPAMLYLDTFLHEADISEE